VVFDNRIVFWVQAESMNRALASVGKLVHGSVDLEMLDFGQASKGTRWMPWRQEAMKDVGSCEKLREVANQTLIRRFPNGETRPGSCPVILH
jgi:hypothetical protein